MSDYKKPAGFRRDTPVGKFAAGGMAGSRNMNSDKSGVAGPRNAGGTSRSAGGNRPSNMGGGKSGVGGMRQGTNNNDVGPRGGPAPRTGLTTGKTWTGNTAYGPAGGRAMGFANSPAEARAKMAAAAAPARSTGPSIARPKTTSVPEAPKKDRPMGLKLAPRLTTVGVPSIPPNAIMYPFGGGNFRNKFNKSKGKTQDRLRQDAD